MSQLKVWGHTRSINVQKVTWGDIPLGAAAQRWFNLPVKRPSHPAVEAWYARVRERPAFKKWIDIPLA